MVNNTGSSYCRTFNCILNINLYLGMLYLLIQHLQTINAIDTILANTQKCRTYDIENFDTETTTVF